MAAPCRAQPLLSLLLCFLAAGHVAVSEPPLAEKAALLSFLSQTPHERRIQWKPSASACDWTGVSCDVNRSHVVALRLPGVGLLGPIPPNTLSHLPRLRVLSLRVNRLSDPLPADLANLTLLRSLYLQGNRLSGELPAGLAGLARLTRLDLSANNFSGAVPFFLGSFRRLTGLFLENNSFSGGLPSIDIPSMTGFNVSYNALNGPIPRPLRRFPASSFAGNLALCGGPLTACGPFFPSSSPSPKVTESPSQGGSDDKNKLSTAAIVAISVASGGVLLLALLLLLTWWAFRRRRPAAMPPKEGAAAPTSAAGAEDEAETATSPSKDDSAGVGVEEGEKNRLVFCEKGLYGFYLEDLLRASAEVLGKGSGGTTYKAVLEEGMAVVVKRLREVAATKPEFELHMEALGKVKHDNVVPVRGFYYSNDEKLLLYDYFPAASLSSLLHGSRGAGHTPPDWDTRVHLALAAGRGLTHLHTSANLVHGNLKASNVLLCPKPHAAAVSDFGLSPLLGGSSTPPANRVAGYRAPEVLETRRPTFQSDVYSFGVLLLELLTGKAPLQASLGEEGIDLPRWVRSVVREEWTAEVFDVDLVRHGDVEEEMVQVLQLAMACVATVPSERPEMQEVVRVLKDVVDRVEGADGRRRSSEETSGGGSGRPSPALSR